jgi:N-methylhydantoinase A
MGCPVVDRETLGSGAALRGPVIVEQLDSTTVVRPGQRARVDRFGNLIVTLGEPPR